MKKKSPKAMDVAKFGGVEELGAVKVSEDGAHELSSIETESTTKLEDDIGYGSPVIIRMFEFGINPEAWKQHKPTTQELFNYHLKGIEIALWKDGLKPFTEVSPRLSVDAKKMKYRIFVGAEPERGHFLNERPKTLTQIAHG